MAKDSSNLVAWHGGSSALYFIFGCYLIGGIPRPIGDSYNMLTTPRCKSELSFKQAKSDQKP